MSFIHDRDQYRDALAQIERVLDVDHRLPACVSRVRPGTTLFFEFEELFEAPLWRAVSELTADSPDTQLIGVVLEPDPVRYYMQEFGYYGALRASIGQAESDIPELLAYEPPQSRADSLVNNARVLAFITDSHSVVIWTERELGLGLMHLPSSAMVRGLPMHVKWFSPSEAVELMAPSFAGGRVPLGFVREFHENYS